nr:acyl-CoA ligase (AMP-forming), exosortase A system-associated [Rhodospirillum rubrum]
MGLSDLLARACDHTPAAPALSQAGATSRSTPPPLTYEELFSRVCRLASGFKSLGLKPGERVAVIAEKRFDAVVAMIAVAHAGGVFVPINPVLKSPQIAHILADSAAKILVAPALRLALLDHTPPPSLTTLLRFGDPAPASPDPPPGGESLDLDALAGAGDPIAAHPVVDDDPACFFYTSGSTGLPKAVVVTHRNLIAGAQSVASRLDNRPDDRLLAALPLGFDAGFSQLTTAFAVGAEAVLHDYLLPQDVIAACAHHRITGLTGVPPLWAQLARLDWPAAATASLRFLANTGGAMPAAVLARLRALAPAARIHLMYGLTEAFRSTTLDPERVERKPGSVGRAVANAEVLVLRPDGGRCAPNEIGEIVHRGAFVAKGYWNDPEGTARRFRPIPPHPGEPFRPGLAVWSGDLGWQDDEGDLTIVGRSEGLIKTSGYRVSPTEIEAPAHASGLIEDAVAFGLPDPLLGERLALVVTAPPGGAPVDLDALRGHLRAQLPAYLVPALLTQMDSLPRTASGKADRAAARARVLKDQGSPP